MEQVVDGRTLVRFDRNGDARAELRIDLHDAINLNRGDFVL